MTTSFSAIYFQKLRRQAYIVWCIRKERRDLLRLISCESATDGGHLKGEMRMPFGKAQEILNVISDSIQRESLQVLIFGRNRIAVALQPVWPVNQALSHY